MTQASEPVHSGITVVRLVYVCSWVGIGIGVFALALLIALQSAVMNIEPDAEFLARPFDVYAVAIFLSLIICSVLVQLGVRLLRGQRRIIEGQQQITELVDVRYAEGYTDATAGKPAAPILRSVPHR